MGKTNLWWKKSEHQLPVQLETGTNQELAQETF